MPITKLTPVITFTEFYNVKSLPYEPLRLIENYELEDVIQTLIVINYHLDKRLRSENLIFNTFINRLPQAKSYLLKLKLNESFEFTNPVVVAKLLTTVFGLKENSQLKLDANLPAFEEALFDLILIYNDLHYRDISSIYHINTHEFIWSMMLIQDTTGFNAVHYARSGNIKHLIFLKFLREVLGSDYNEFEQDFCERIGCDNIYSFLAVFANIYMSIENGLVNKNLPTVVFEEDDTSYNLLKRLNLIVSKSESIDNVKVDLSFYVAHPFFEHTNGKFYVIDHRNFAFAIDKLWQYILFKNSNIGKHINANKFNDYQSFLGKEFYEKFLLSKMFKTLNRSGFRVIETDDKQLPDVSCILNEKDIFLFEIKSSSLHYKVIEDKDLVNFKSFIDNNFSSTKKGAGQLVKNINYLSEDDNKLYKLRAPNSKITVYPIIIFTENHLDRAAVNDYVRVKFDDMMLKSSTSFREIKPIVMIHYDFFIENMSLIEKKPNLLKMAIDNYINYCKKKRKTFIKTQENFDYLASMIPFDTFMINYKGLYRTPQIDIFKKLATLFKLRD